MQRVPGHYEVFHNATTLRAEVQAELILNAFAFVKDSIKSKVPAFGPLYSSSNYSMCMRALGKRTASL